MLCINIFGKVQPPQVLNVVSTPQPIFEKHFLQVRNELQ
jgi:hypothetical protein